MTSRPSQPAVDMRGVVSRRVEGVHSSMFWRML
jgi:hypothetical protein